MATLIFFTHSFPFGHQEYFIETEIQYLAKAYEKIIIVPFVYGDSHSSRVIPKNVEVLNPILEETSKFSILLHGILNLSTIKPFLLDFSLSKLIPMLKHTIIARFLATHSQYKALMAIPDSVAYFYWGTNWSNVLAFKKAAMPSVVRFHGYDLYQRLNFHLPFRKSLFKNIDHPIFISQHGLQYASKKYDLNAQSLILARLGVEHRGFSKPSIDGVFRIVSCSNLVPLKRVALLSKAIESIKEVKIEWTHFGDGPEKNAILKNASLKFKGRVSNKEVQDFYLTNPVDLFINVSESEGLPVSIMEALAAGIPVMATDAGGTNEIVKEILPIQINPLQLADRIKDFFLQNYENKMIREQAFETWQKIANAKDNYLKFSSFLVSLKN